jgi:hypothetical protein
VLVCAPSEGVGTGSDSDCAAGPQRERQGDSVAGFAGAGCWVESEKLDDGGEGGGRGSDEGWLPNSDCIWAMNLAISGSLYVDSRCEGAGAAEDVVFSLSMPFGMGDEDAQSQPIVTMLVDLYNGNNGGKYGDVQAQWKGPE